MVLMSYDEVDTLFQRFHDFYRSCNCEETCNTSDTTAYSVCGLLRRASETRIVAEYFLSEAARRWKPFTDITCGIGQCQFCPNSWCHRLREIYDEGVLCYDTSNH